ncbi:MULTISPECIES: ADP-ribosylglycohydrolase family protein [Actinosynnema]|uniref:ADP-ribosylglycohydrolase family protein n=1 Tax=Actinosynnema TaxID=40566 RepID=UPI0020A61A7F|nr:ADP-ribosylglycohydrolase family protein [Actinosynnema pretiosum]MCP2096836.1 ADP-ribosylglycohydrolase [Actinosynnema pretiosum]
MPREPMAVVDRGAACLLGGALGDALGAPVQYLGLPDIQRDHGPDGVQEPPWPALVTDDTQLTLFSADGYLRAWVRGKSTGEWEPVDEVWNSYRRWLVTQQFAGPDEGAAGLLAQGRLYASRSPGLTCLRALAADVPPTPEAPINESSGCNGVTRTAPAGFAPHPDIAYDLGCRFAALTHGGTGGWVSGGAFALLIHLLAVRGRPLREAVDQVIGRVLRDDPYTANALNRAVVYAEEQRASGGPVRVDRLGSGWTGPEALAIAVHVVLVYPKRSQFVDALRAAVNHSGGSDATASLTGNILGALHGTAGLPRDWLAGLELVDVLAAIGADLGCSVAGLEFDESLYR